MDQKFALEGIVLLVSRSVHSKASEMGPMFGRSKTGPMSVHLKALGSCPMFVQDGTVGFRLKFGHWRAGFPPLEFPPVLVVV